MRLSSGEKVDQPDDIIKSVSFPIPPVVLKTRGVRSQFNLSDQLTILSLLLVKLVTTVDRW